MTDPLSDPHTYAGGLTGWEMYTDLYDSLLQLSPDDKQVEPMLAKSWSWNADSTQLTLKLRNDVTFQDGTPFNAQVAVENLKAGAPAAQNGATALKLMTNVVAVDPTTLQLTFSGPDPDAIFSLASFPGMMVSPAGLANPKELALHPAGSGPYELASVSAALTFTLDRWSGYWNKSHVYPAQYIEMNASNETARFNEVRTGQADFTIISALNYSTAKADSNLQVVSYQHQASYAAFMNNKVAPFNNPMVEEAVSMAINRDAFNASQNGLCTPVSEAFPPQADGYSSSVTPPAFNVAQAKQLIQQAGATGATVNLVSIAFEPYNTFSQLLQNQLDAIGLNVKISLQPGATFRVLYGQGSYGMMLAPINYGAPDPSALLDAYILGAQNPGTKPAALVSMATQAEQMPIGSSQRTAAMTAINADLTNTDIPWVSICQDHNIFVGSKKLIGLNAIPIATISSAATYSFIQVAK